MDRSLPNTDPRNSYSPKTDEVILDCPDDYEGLIFKTRAICGYVAGKNISHALFVDTDTCVFVKKFLALNFDRIDYMGRFNGEFGAVGPREVRGPGGTTSFIPQCYSWASGAGYLLSSQAARTLADKYPQPSAVGGYGGNEDVWVGQMLGPLVAKGDLVSEQFPYPVVKYYVDANGDSNTYNPKSGWMEQTWKENQ